MGDGVEIVSRFNAIEALGPPAIDGLPKGLMDGRPDILLVSLLPPTISSAFES